MLATEPQSATCYMLTKPLRSPSLANGLHILGPLATPSIMQAFPVTRYSTAETRLIPMLTF